MIVNAIKWKFKTKMPANGMNLIKILFRNEHLTVHHIRLSISDILQVSTHLFKCYAAMQSEIYFVRSFYFNLFFSIASSNDFFPSLQFIFSKLKIFQNEVFFSKKKKNRKCTKNSAAEKNDFIFLRRFKRSTHVRFVSPIHILCTRAFIK